MPITVNSPYSGRPVKIRDQDLGRAVRDEEGRIFYVVARAEGDGYYAAPTRKGSAKDEQRYDALETKMDAAQVQVDLQHAAVHDATGRRRRGSRARWLVVVLLLLVVGAAAYYGVVYRGGGDPGVGPDRLELPGLPGIDPSPGEPVSPSPKPGL
ncbi:MAG: hypothetical protein AAGG38_04305 [Planctomycetota bacterium]